MKINEELIAELVKIDRVIVRHSEDMSMPQRGDAPPYAVRCAVRSEQRAKREQLLGRLDTFEREAHSAIARAEAEAAEWREYAKSFESLRGEQLGLLGMRGAL